MSAIKFTKAVASGNDFIIIENYHNHLPKLARNFCDRKCGIGADGLLVLEKSSKADFKMRIFNPDGSEAEMCGNGLRCAALFNNMKRVETKAGILEAEVKGGQVKVKMTQPKDIKLNIALKINDRNIKVNFINTGVPHAVIFVEGLNKIDVKNIGEKIRFHQKFMPKGANVDFVEIINDNNIKVRTYERGVEDETLACGTGAVASAIISIISAKRKAQSAKQYVINVHTKSKEELKVYFTFKNNKISDVYLRGQAKIVYQGSINI